MANGTFLLRMVIYQPPLGSQISPSGMADLLIKGHRAPVVHRLPSWHQVNIMGFKVEVQEQLPA